jgi:Tol biopolymer transport system component
MFRQQRAAILTFCCAALLAAAAPAAADDYGIFITNLDGTRVRKVVQVPGYDYHAAPRWSHDGKRLAFDVRKGPDYGRATIYLVNVDGTGLRQFAEEANSDWSPDDKQLVFSVYGGHREKEGVYVQNVDGGGREYLVYGASPRWNADGSKIAYTDWRTVKCLDLASGEHQNLVGVVLDERPFQFDWSRDGTRLAFIARQHGAKTRELYVINPAEFSRELAPRWATPLDFPGFLSWSPDGKTLAITPGYHIHLLEVDGTGAPQRLPGQTTNSYEPHWSPDGKSIAFARRPVPKS